MDAIGVFDHFVDMVGKSVFLLVQGVHLERAATLAGHTVVIPPRELGDEDGLVVALHQEIVDGVLQDFLATICEQHTLLGNTVDLAETHGDNTLLALVVDTGVEAKILRVEVLHCVKHFLAWLKIEFVSIEVIHI